MNSQKPLKYTVKPSLYVHCKNKIVLISDKGT
jgi:hypothetical protein